VRLLLSCIACTLRLLPRALQLMLGSGIGILLNRVFRFRRAIIEMHLAIAFPERDPAALCELRNRVYRHFGRMVIEILSFPCIPAKRFLKHVEWEGLGHLDAAIAKGKGVCLLCGHLGSWEVPCIGLAAAGYDIRAIGKEMKSKAGETFRIMLRDENGVATIPRRGSMRDIVRGLKKNGVIAFVLDQNMTSDEGEFVDFFGHSACTMTNLAVIAKRTGATILPGHTWRDESGKHHCIVLPEIFLDADESATESTQYLTQILEQMIREHPEQWLWIHKRWRTRPDGEKNSPFNYRRRK
jgi:KDO2-lipid IV(A) lauroyltransferase